MRLHAFESQVNKLAFRACTNPKAMSDLIQYLSKVKDKQEMMTSSTGNSFPITGHLRGEFTGEFPAQRPVMRGFDAFFDLRLIKRLSKQSWGWLFETPSRPLWRHGNELCMVGTREVFGILGFCIFKNIEFTEIYPWLTYDTMSENMIMLVALLLCFAQSIQSSDWYFITTTSWWWWMPSAFYRV